MALKKMKVLHSTSSAETKRIGAAFARTCAAKAPKNRALVVALKGDLGAGKTTFVQGFFKGLAARGRATSPTFILMRRTPLSHPRFKNIFHIDAYRTANLRAVRTLGIKDILRDPSAVVLIEWADRIARIVPKSARWVRFAHGAGDTLRTISL